MSELRTKMKKIQKNNKGFTLVELIIVVAVILVLVTVLAPQYTQYVERTRESNDLQIATSLMRATTVIVADPKNEIPANEHFSVQWATRSGGSTSIIVGNRSALAGTHSSGAALDDHVRDELAKIMGLTQTNVGSTYDPTYDIYAQSEVARDQSFLFEIDADTGEITIPNMSLDSGWSASGRWVTEIGVNP